MADFTIVDSIPCSETGKKTNRHNMDLFDKFLASNGNYAEVNGYTLSAEMEYNNLRMSVSRGGYSSRIKICKRGDKIYLVRR